MLTICGGYWSWLLIEAIFRKESLRSQLVTILHFVSTSLTVSVALNLSPVLVHIGQTLRKGIDSTEVNMVVAAFHIL